MVTQYFGGQIPAPRGYTELDNELIALCEGTLAKVRTDMDNLSAPDALADIFKIVQRANKYIDETMPWALNKNGDKDRLQTVMYVLCECIRFSATMLKPFIPETADRIFAKLGISAPDNFDGIAKFGGIAEGTTVTKGENLFNRIDVNKELAELQRLADEQAQATKPTTEAKPQAEQQDVITIEDFAKIKLRTAKVISCEKVAKSDKLLVFKLQLGDEVRQVVSGIAQHYAPQDLVGKTVVIVANLKPAKIRGVESNGMILCAADGTDVVFVTPQKEIGSGVEVR